MAKPPTQANSRTPEHPQAQALTEEERGIALEVAGRPDILGLIEETMRGHGLAGDATPSLLCSLALTSAILDRPLNVSLVGPSSVGKQQKLDRARELHPEDAYHFVSAASPTALIYGNANLKHRTVVFAEADSIPDGGQAASFVRALVQDEEAVYEVTEQRKDGGFGTRRIRHKGPTGLITTSIQSLRTQLRTRVLEIHLEDTPEAVWDVLQAVTAKASGHSSEPPDVQPLLCFHRWLRSEGLREAVIPFAPAIIDALRTSGFVPYASMNRQIPHLLSVLKTIALIHHRNRELDDGGRVIVTLDDYSRARRMLAPVFDTRASEGLTEVVRETVEAVEPGDELSLTELADRLNIAKSTAHERLEQAYPGKHLINHEWRRGHPARIRRGEPLPPPQDVLPSVNAVRAAEEEIRRETHLSDFASEAEAIIDAFIAQLTST